MDQLSGADNESMARGNAGLLDVFFLTFNCAKTPVDVDVFARHLRGALVQHGTQQQQQQQRQKRYRGSSGDSEEEEGAEARSGRGVGLPDLVVL